MTDDSETLDLFAGAQYVYGEVSMKGEIEVIKLPESLEEPIPQVSTPLQIDTELEAVLHGRIDSTVEMLDATIEHDVEGQLAFIDLDEWWKIEWQNMPEFTQNDVQPWKDLIVHFRTRDDMLEFGRLMNQRLTNETKSIWYPEMLRQIRANLFYIDAE